MIKELTNVDSNSSAETGVDSSNLAEAYSVNQNGTKTNVGSSACLLSPQILHITNSKPLSKETIEMLNKIVEKLNKLYVKN